MHALTRILGALALPALLAVALMEQATEPLVNVALPSQGTRIVADTQYSEQVRAENVADGRWDTGYACWFSQDWTRLPCALTFEFASRERLRRAVLYQAVWSGSMYHTKDYAIEVSDDGQTWRRIATGRMEDVSGSKHEVGLQAEAKWLRVVVLTSYIPFQTCGFAEVEILAERPVSVGSPGLLLNGKKATVTEESAGQSLAFVPNGPQVTIQPGEEPLVIALNRGESLKLRFAVGVQDEPAVLKAEATQVGGKPACLTLEYGTRAAACQARARGGLTELSLPIAPGSSGTAALRIEARDTATVRVRGIRVETNERMYPVPIRFDATDYGAGPPPTTPVLRPAIVRSLIEWDWQAQDGVGTPRLARPLPAVVRDLLAQGDRLAGRLPGTSRSRQRWQEEERKVAARLQALSPSAMRSWYLRLHGLKRAMLLEMAGPELGPIVFAKQVPGCFSHQLTQYYGRYARPGGGIFVLEHPGESMKVHSLTDGRLPLGSFMLPEVSWDADRVMFAYCEAPTTPSDTIQGHRGRYYHLYSVRADGSGLRQITSGPYDDFAPRYLPSGRIVFISTRRGGWHRCGTPGCENYVLTVANTDGTAIRPISFHETQEWDPAVLPDGRLVYTRWDYVDRHPVFYEHLWTTTPDGVRPAALFGNNTFNPVGIWEARPVPRSRKLMATAAAHHAMTAGSIILVDPARGVDGLGPITRLTPDVPFPESETPVSPNWYAPMPGTQPLETEQNRRWPGHTYRSPYPLSERMFLAAYSFRQLVGEPRGNAANMYGLYLCDADGNKELLYRDPSISSLWPVLLRPRSKPPVVPPSLDARLGDQGIFVLQDVYRSLPEVPRGSIKALRIVQVVPKSTPGKDMPPIGIPSGAPGKQVLGTVPVEADGSAHFLVPARKELAFQALDERGMAVQVMRSGTYVQPGEKTTCVGCHEPRTTAPPRGISLAQRRPPSRIAPGLDGSKPLSYPILVQTVLDKRCVSCHNGSKAAGGVVLTGDPEGHYTRSYNALAPRVPFSDMGNGEALSRPDRYGARASGLMKMLLEGHQGVRLSSEEIVRLATWMDVSALFYGTFDPEDQARQRLGMRVRGPKLE